MKKQAKKTATLPTPKAEANAPTKPLLKSKPTEKNTGGDMRATPDGKYDSGYKSGDEVW